MIILDFYQGYLFTGIILIVVAAIVCMVLANVINNRDKFKVKKSKKRVDSTRVNKAMIGGQLAVKLNENADSAKRYKMETRILNAGYSFSYGEFKLICMACAIAIPAIVYIAIQNIYMAVVFGVIGYFLPGQLLKYLANARIRKMEDQVGSFIRLVMERYKTSKDMSTAVVNTLPDFQDCEPLYHELKLMVVDINLGIPSADALDGLARRTGNKFMARFANYFRITDRLSTFAAKVELLNQAYEQYQEDISLKRMLKKEISGPVSESYMMVAMTPVFMIWQSIQDPSYLDFMLNDNIGQIGLTVIFVVLLLAVIFINVKIGGPLE